MYYLGVDLGGTNIAAGIIDENGKFLTRHSITTRRERDQNEIINDIISLCKQMISQSGVSIKSIGIGSPGICDNKNGIIIYANNIKFKNVKIVEIINKQINLPIFIGNDANCAALAESNAGAAKGYDNSITITIGTGIGGGCIINNRLVTGSFFNGSELGHTVIKLDGEICSCGRRGCLEAYASATSLIREIKFAAIRNPESQINNLVNGDLSKITPKTVFDAANLNDSVALNVINNFLNYLSVGIINFINIFDPEIILIGGGVSEQKEVLLKPLRERIKKESYGGNLKTKIEVAQLGNDAGIIGAAFLCKYYH